MNKNGYILLYNPISNEGHLDSWHVLFIELVSKSGFGVIAVCNDPEGLRLKLKHKGIYESDHLVVLDATDRTTGPHSLLKKFWHRGNALYGRLMFRQRKTSLDPVLFFDRVNQLIDRYTGQIRLVFNMYVDAYPSDPQYWKNLSFLNSLPWVGLCITPGAHPSEGYYALQTYKGTCLLDEAICKTYQQEMPGRIFEFLPDITEIALPKQRSALANEILSFAAGRKIVFMGGSIGKQKNLARWYDLIGHCDQSQWFFVQMGRINTNNLTLEDESALKKIQDNPLENLFTYPEYVKDERVFNEIISISDVIFAVYRDFARSSNMLSKAAYFEKPILVAENCLMGQRVRRYKIGLEVDPNDSTSMYRGLKSLLNLDGIKDNFHHYRVDFNALAVQNKLSEFIHASLKS
ncbi:MAG: hypothetical protein WBL16_14875 [Zwartia sp.]|uniref:hypothetical protein n=1 Tax=Zwartia sp. TaxID=2978004 RepID=UPI003C74758F